MVVNSYFLFYGDNVVQGEKFPRVKVWYSKRPLERKVFEARGVDGQIPGLDLRCNVPGNCDGIPGFLSALGIFAR